MIDVKLQRREYLDDHVKKVMAGISGEKGVGTLSIESGQFNR